jgi:hypothetical protein
MPNAVTSAEPLIRLGCFLRVMAGIPLGGGGHRVSPFDGHPDQDHGVMHNGGQGGNVGSIIGFR